METRAPKGPPSSSHLTTGINTPEESAQQISEHWFSEAPVTTRHGVGMRRTEVTRIVGGENRGAGQEQRYKKEGESLTVRKIRMARPAGISLSS